MSKLKSVSRTELLRRLRRLGFEGPFSGGKHEFMVRGDVTLYVPNPHRRVIGADLLVRILKQAGIGRDEWSE